MPSDQTRRGRPKGSGLDDTDQLRKVARMLEADPDLKPTTAIKAIGISDPSTIRRLRDKLRGANEAEGISVGLGSPDLGDEAKRLDGAVNEPPRFVGSFSASRETPLGLAAAAPTEIEEAAPRAVRRDLTVGWLQAWCGLGLFALSATVEAQFAVFESFLSVPEIASAIRHQASLSEQVVAFYSYGTDVRTTLH